MATVPTFELPNRCYYPLRGSIDEAAALEDLDLWWPDDRVWYVATDVDLDWCYVAGTAAFTDAVAAALPGRTRPAERAEPI